MNRFAVLAELARSGGWMRKTRVKALRGLKLHRVRKLIDSGLVARNARGRYRITGKGHGVLEGD